MKIAVITVEINPHSGSRAPLEFARALAKLSHEVTLLASKDNSKGELLKQLTRENVRVEFINSGGLKKVFEMAKILKKNTYDVISFHATPSLFLGAKLSGLPIVRTYYGTQLDAIKDKFFPYTNMFITLANWFGNMYTQTVERYILSHSNKIVAISTYAQEEVKKLYRLSADSCYLGTSSFIHQTNKELTRDKKKTITILSVSRIVPYKRFHLLIQIVNNLVDKYPQLRLQIVGRATNRRYLNYFKSLTQPHISILTEVPDATLMNLYRQANIYVTCDRYLFFGLPILEAAKTGLPVVALDTCAANEVITHGKTGYVADSLTEFSQFLSELIDSSQLRFKMGRAAKHFAERFTWEQTARKYEKIFKSLF